MFEICIIETKIFVFSGQLNISRAHFIIYLFDTNYEEGGLSHRDQDLGLSGLLRCGSNFSQLSVLLIQHSEMYIALILSQLARW